MPDEPILSGPTLPQSRLIVMDGRLVRRTADNKTLSEITLSSIKDIIIRSRTEWGAITFGLIFIGLGTVCKLYIATDLLAWSLCVILGLIGLLALIGSRQLYMVVKTTDGDATFELQDPRLDAEAFALTV